MGCRRLYDHRGSVVRELIVDDPRDPCSAFALGVRQDVEPLLARNAALAEAVYGDGRAGGPGRGEFTFVGTLPVAVAEQALREGWLFDDARLTRFFNDPDNARLRVWGGRL